MKNRTLVAILAVLACFALLPRAQAVSPAPDGCYPNYTTAEGCSALQNLVDGLGNTGLGWYGLFSDVNGSFNTAVGGGALVLNTADSNTAVGAAALLLNTTGFQNVAVGTDALVFNDSGSGDNAVGAFALYNNTTGYANVAIGNNTMSANTGGTFNTAVGNGAGENLATGIENIYIGDFAGTADFLGVSPGDESGVIRIGSVFSGTTACYINGILANFIPQAPGNSIVTIDSTTGQLGWTTDFAAAKVEEQQKKIEQQQASIADLKSTVALQQKGMQLLTAQLKEQAAQIQKVSAQIEISKPATKVVVNKP